MPISFYGTSYNSLFICSNGYVTFGNGSADFTESMAVFFNGFGVAPPNPGVALYYSDLNRGGVTSGATYDVTENQGLGTVGVAYNNQNH